MTSDRISVIMPYYNGSIPLLKRALHSIENLHYSNIEAIIVDDGSETALQIEDTVFPFDIRIIRHTKNQGISGARNTAISHATGNWLLWLDCDDKLDAHCLEKMLPHIADDTLMVIGECYVYEKDSISLRKPAIFFELAKKYWKTLYDPFMTNIFSLQPQLVKRSAVVEIGAFNVQYPFAEMTEFFLRFITNFGIKHIAMAQSAYYHYNRNMPNSVSCNRTQLEQYRLFALREYALRTNLPIDEIIYIGRCNLGTQVYAPIKGGRLFLAPYMSFNSNNLKIGGQNNGEEDCV